MQPRLVPVYSPRWGQGMANPYPGLISPGQFFGWALGPAIGILPLCVAQLIFLLYPDRFRPADIFWLTLILTVAGAFLGGGLGYLLSCWFDEPADRQFFWDEFRPAFLFGIIGAVLLYSLLTFPLMPYLIEHYSTARFLLPLAAFVAGLVPAGANGIINNFRYSSGSPGEHRSRTRPKSRA